MTHRYIVTGMTCGGCQAKVQKLLEQADGVKKVHSDWTKDEVEIEMDKHIPTAVLRSALKDYPRYQLSETPVKKVPAGLVPAGLVPAGLVPADAHDNKIPIGEGNDRIIPEEAARSWWVTYKPILLIFGYITLVSLIAGNLSDAFDSLLAMRVFMSGFFLTFSFFKMLDLKGFAESYSMYDIVARQFNGWGYIYGFIELALGISFALDFHPFLINLITLIIMTVSIIGVLQSVFNKRKIRCACLGAVFNLPMSTVTIVEDAVMILMSGILLLQMV